MTIICELVFDYPAPDIARTIFASVSPEDAGYVESKLEGSSIFSTISAKSLNSLLHTLDDYISCIQVAEKVAGQ